jgi:hypothetical protein
MLRLPALASLPKVPTSPIRRTDPVQADREFRSSPYPPLS